MKEVPMLFSTAMIKALIEGWKTQTRRIVKSRTGYFQVGIEKETKRVLSVWATDDEEMWQYDMSCPYSQAGDHIYVKETHYRYGQWWKNGTTKTGKQKWEFHPDDKITEIKFIDNPPKNVNRNSHRALGWYKRPSLFMPKEAARIWLEVTSVSVERLQDISWEDAVAEGCPGYRPNQDEPTHQYKRLWESINGPESWNKNPFVWKISFKVLSTTGKPQHVDIKP